jgi:hypothetical protein
VYFQGIIYDDERATQIIDTKAPRILHIPKILGISIWGMDLWGKVN